MPSEAWHKAIIIESPRQFLGLVSLMKGGLISLLRKVRVSR